MILGISPVSVNNNYVRSRKPVKHASAPSFHGLTSNMCRYTGLGLAALTMFAATSCNWNNKSDTNNTTDSISIEAPIGATGITNSSATEKEEPNNRPRKTYHYAPSEEQINSENYSWTETIFPDGTVKRDSSGYDITIDPDGSRTVEYTLTDEQGCLKTVKEFPDGTKSVLTLYNIPNDTLYVKTTYWANGNMKLREYFNRNMTDSLTQTVDSAKYEYNENGILVKWIDGIKDPERSDKNNVYDRYGRLEYDDVANEKLYYKGKNRIPYQAISQYDGCIRYKLFNPDSTLQKVYFEAQDGTITDADN